MADQNIGLNPNGDFAFRTMVKLGDVSVRLRFRWLSRVTAWWLLVETPDGEALTVHAAVRSEGSVLIDTSNPAAPVGGLRWKGRDPTTPEDLGSGIVLVWSEPDD